MFLLASRHLLRPHVVSICLLILSLGPFAVYILVSPGVSFPAGVVLILFNSWSYGRGTTLEGFLSKGEAMRVPSRGNAIGTRKQDEAWSSSSCGAALRARLMQ